MNAKKTLVNQIIDQETINQLIIDSIQDKKAKDVVLLDLRELDEAPTDYFIICHGDSHTQVSAIADNVVTEVKKKTNQHPVSVVSAFFMIGELVGF
ncbi:MAG: RsfS/YbeB/iojap family protein, partial [Bacteroidota bacterium]